MHVWDLCYSITPVIQTNKILQSFCSYDLLHLYRKCVHGLNNKLTEHSSATLTASFKFIRDFNHNRHKHCLQISCCLLKKTLFVDFKGIILSVNYQCHVFIYLIQASTVFKLYVKCSNHKFQHDIVTSLRIYTSKFSRIYRLV